MKGNKIWNALRPYVMIFPAMAAIACFVIYPVIYLFRLSLYRYNLLNPAQSRFIGLQNYEMMLQKADFHQSLVNTFIYTFAIVVLTVSLALLCAVWINSKYNRKISNLLQAGMFTPHIISIVSIALVWMLLMEPSYGMLNYVLQTLGLPTSDWLQSSKSSLMSIVLVSLWHNLGYFTLIILAALQSVPPSIYEAASLDNAKPWQTFFKITLPMISPQLFFVLIIITIGSFKVFDTVKIMPNGGPNNSTSTLVFHIFEYRSNNLGYASATGIVLMILITILTIIYFRMLAKRVHYQ